MEKNDIPGNIDGFSNESKRQKADDHSQSLESLLLDDFSQSRSVDSLAEQEVRVVAKKKESRFGFSLVFLLLIILLSGVGYYYFISIPKLNLSANHSPLFVSARFPVPERSIPTSPERASIVDKTVSTASNENITAEVSQTDSSLPLFTVFVGPFLNSKETQRSTLQLKELGFQPQVGSGRGQVLMVRLLEGVYPAEEAREHLDSLKRVVDSAFLLLDGNRAAVYAGSFYQRERAEKMQESLAEEKIIVRLVDHEIVLNGTILSALQADQQTAREVAAHLSSLGLRAQVKERE